MQKATNQKRFFKKTQKDKSMVFLSGVGTQKPRQQTRNVGAKKGSLSSQIVIYLKKEGLAKTYTDFKKDNPSSLAKSGTFSSIKAQFKQHLEKHPKAFEEKTEEKKGSTMDLVPVADYSIIPENRPSASRDTREIDSVLRRFGLDKATWADFRREYPKSRATKHRFQQRIYAHRTRLNKNGNGAGAMVPTDGISTRTKLFASVARIDITEADQEELRDIMTKYLRPIVQQIDPLYKMVKVEEDDHLYLELRRENR